MESVVSVDEILMRARSAQRVLARVGSAGRDRALDAVQTMVAEKAREIIEANRRDIMAAVGLTEAMRDRLVLTPGRIEAMVRAVGEVRQMGDPLEGERFVRERPNGLRVYKRRVALGVIAVVYEARPNVTVEASALTLRSGNAVVLRGGSEAIETNTVLARAVREGLRKARVPEDAVGFVADRERERVIELARAVGRVDLLIPRGGEKLMEVIDANARVPVVRHGRGVCHVYVDRGADVEKAVEIVVNAKTSRPGVCNAVETLLVHGEVLERVLPVMGRKLEEKSVSLRAGAGALEVFQRAGVKASPAVETDWDEEFLGLTLAVKSVRDLDEAIDHIAVHGTGHTAAVVTEDETVAERFLAEVEASCVLLNASTRFNDGGELGLGAEIGISTTRMHAWGPMSATELTAEKFVVRGTGQVRP